MNGYLKIIYGNMINLPHPNPFLEVRVQDINIDPCLIAMCAGYESEQWRCKQLAEHVIEWLPEFALKYSEIEALGHENAVRMIKKSAKAIYKTDKFQKRGEFGELLLHIMIRQVFKTIPAISKIYYKDSRNDTVKGFDCVHIVISQEDSIELWLGEVKFYSEIGVAIRDVIKELESHTQNDYLKDEFTAITNKIDEKLPHYDKLKKLLDTNTSLDEIFKVVCIPILLTYNSQTISKYKQITEDFKKEYELEVRSNWDKFKNNKLPQHIIVRLFLLPLKSKDELQKELHTELSRWK